MTVKINPSILIIIIGIAVFLCWVIFRGCNPVSSNAIDKKSFDSLLVAKQKSEEATSKIIDSVFKENNRRAVKEDSLALIVHKKDEQLSIKTLSITALAKEVQLYAKYKDTVEQLKAAPLLADQVIGLVEKVDEYKRENRSLLNSIDSSIGANSLLLAQKDYQYTELQERFSFASDKYLKLDKNYSSLNKKLKRERTLSRILGVAVLVTGGIILSK